jgi:ATP diphosphatase
VDTGDRKKTIEDLIGVMAALRAPETGCPWDLEQTFETIAPYTIEEAYEVADAIQRGDLTDLKEELGDLLLQVVYHARIAEEQDGFAFGDVAHAVTEKMIRRHPHVFGDEAQRAAGAAEGFWERIKSEERAAKAAERARLGQTASISPAALSSSILDDVPVGMPGLTRALKLQDKAARVGFDWPQLTSVFDKLHEELTELQDALTHQRTSATDETKAHVEEEFGDLLFVLANIGRHLDIDPAFPPHRTAARGAGPVSATIGSGRDGRSVGRGKGPGTQRQTRVGLRSFEDAGYLASMSTPGALMLTPGCWLS